MTTRQTSIDEDDFQAFVDGQLPPEQVRLVMAYLAAEPEEAARMSDYRAINGELHRVYDEVLYEPLPARLQVRHYRGRTSWWARLLGGLRWSEFGVVPRFASVAALVVAGGVGWMLSDHYHYTEPEEAPGLSFARQAANAHTLFASDYQHPVEFGADQTDSLLLWLSDRLGQAVNAPNLEDLRFGLVGGRLLPASGQAAAQLMYEDPDANRITLYIRGRWQGALETVHERTVNFAGEGGVSMVYWTEGAFAYALIGELDREQLFGIAKTVQQQLAIPTGPAPEQTATAEKKAT